VLGRLADARSGPQLVKVREKKVNEYAAEIEVARAALNQAALDLEHTKVYAPCDGRVTRKSIDVGEQVQVGRFLMAIVSKEVWVEANFRETQLTDMRVGQSVEIRVDTYPGRVFVGHVESIQAGTGSRFSLLPPQNATGNYVKVVQRVPVKILFDELPEDDLLLVPGMSVIPKVRVR
jgi:membrane fusion protein (multidrug efflux system)